MKKSPSCTRQVYPPTKGTNTFSKLLKPFNIFPWEIPTLKTISIKFLDTDDKILQLQDGQPSIMQFHLRKVTNKMAYNIIHLQVDNRSDVQAHPQITPDNFYDNLKTPIYLNPGAKIALTDISYPNSIQKLPTDLDAAKLINQMNEQRDIYHETISFDLLRKSCN